MALTRLLALSAGLLLAALLWRRRRRLRAADRRFGVRRFGSRNGVLSIRLPDVVAVANYEAGGSVDLIVYRRGMRTREGTGLTGQQRDDALEALARWAEARGTTISIAQD